MVCETRYKIEAEKEAEAIAPVTGEREEGTVPIPKSEQKALPGCTKEGVVYILECESCRKTGKEAGFGESYCGSE